MTQTAAEERTQDTITRLTDEYARLHQRVQKECAARDAGEDYSIESIGADVSVMKVLSNTIALLTGTDQIIQTHTLQAQARLREDDIFPINSHLSTGRLLYSSRA